MLILLLILVCFCTIRTFALYNAKKNGTSVVDGAAWSVTRSQSQSGDSIDIIPEVQDDTYLLTVQSSSEVDVGYSIIISNLPAGVTVSIDGENFITPTNNTVTISNVGRINYSDSTKIKNYTLTFRANSNASPVAGRQINIDVQFKQVV